MAVLVWHAGQHPKCVKVAITASTGRAYNPNLTLRDQPIPYLGDVIIRFLGVPVATSAETRNYFVTKLSAMLQRADNTSITRQQKFKLFKISICPRLTLDLSISDLPVSKVLHRQAW